MVKYELFKNKHCFISGATGGLGRYLAIKMAQNGCDLFLTSKHISKLEDLANKLRSYGGQSRIFYKQADLNSVKDINTVIKVAKEKLSTIDILINCAGIFIVKSLFDSDLDNFETSLNVNLRAVFMFSKAFTPDMVKSKWGRIINIGSSSAYKGYKNSSIYCTSKHAVLGFSRALREELKDHNIRVFCVLPSAMKTKMGKLIKDQDYNTFLNPEEVADYIVYISSFDAEMVVEGIRLSRIITW
jgi:short-subunit dehydrogenase